MNILISLCARAGSKGIPGKNIKLLAGIPLISYSIRSALEFAKHYNCNIAISTDDPKALAILAEYGIVTNYKRPPELATDTSGKVETIRDLLQYEETTSGKRFDYVLDLDITSPLRTIQDLLKSFEMIKSDPVCLNLFSVNKAVKNPYFNMVEQKDNGFYGLVKKGNFKTRQSARPVFEMNASFYFYKRSFFDDPVPKVVNDYSLIFCMDHICFDLDHPIDFEFLSFLVENNKLDFKF